MNNNHQPEEGRAKIKSRLWVMETVRNGDPLPFPCLSLDSSLGMKPACRIDRPGTGFFCLTSKNLLAWQK